MNEYPIEWKWKGHYLKIGVKKYLLPTDSVIREYEVVERVNKQEGDVSTPDGVNIMPIVVSKVHNTRQLLLIRNYRPPVDKQCIEFPAGLIDPGESIETAALRELKEETGYSGRIIKDRSSPLLPVCAGTGSESTVLVPVLIDADAPENAHSQQQLDKSEVIDPILVDLNELDQSIYHLYEEGYGIELQIYYLALGYKLDRFMHDKG